MTVFRSFCLATLCLFSAALAGCLEKEHPSGTVALVNGRAIGLTELEAVRNSMFTGPSSMREIPDDAVLRQQYALALREILLQEMAEQELESRQLLPDPAELDRLEAEIRCDYPAGAYEAMLEEQGMDAALVRLLLRRRLVMEQYVAKVLRREVSVTTEEVQAYYEAHRKDFVLPEQWHYLQIVAGIKEDAVAAGKALADEVPVKEVQKGFGGTLREVRMPKVDLPDDLRAVLETMTPGVPGPPVITPEGFRVLIFLDKVPEAQPAPAQITARVETILLENKLPETFERTLLHKLAKADVRIAAPLLRRDVLPETAPLAGKATAQGNGTNDGTGD